VELIVHLQELSIQNLQDPITAMGRIEAAGREFETITADYSGGMQDLSL
jgi:hypothetical protein